MSHATDVAAAVALLGGPPDDPAVDFLVDPGAACQALDSLPEHGSLLVRVAPPAGASTAAHGPAPVAPLWMRITGGARELGLAQPGEEGSAPTGMVRRAARVEIEVRDEPCCESPGCDRRRAHTAAWLVLEPYREPGAPERLLVAEHRALATEADPGATLGIASRLARALDVPAQRDGEPLASPAGDPPEPIGALLPIADLARFDLRTEGARVVLRDRESTGPRASSSRNAWIGVALLVAAAAGWLQLWRSLGAGGSSGMAVASGAGAALLSLAGYAFLGVARFSARYRASSAPLWAVGRDRLVVLPWVSREGAVDARPEGRIGAAIALGEVRGARPERRKEGVAVALDTDHGLIDVMVCPDEASAALWCGVLDRVIDEARHPRQGATARQRAKQRVAATA